MGLANSRNLALEQHSITFGYFGDPTTAQKRVFQQPSITLAYFGDPQTDQKHVFDKHSFTCGNFGDLYSKKRSFGEETKTAGGRLHTGAPYLYSKNVPSLRKKRRRPPAHSSTLAEGLGWIKICSWRPRASFGPTMAPWRGFLSQTQIFLPQTQTCVCLSFSDRKDTAVCQPQRSFSPIHRYLSLSDTEAFLSLIQRSFCSRLGDLLPQTQGSFSLRHQMPSSLRQSAPLAKPLWR